MIETHSRDETLAWGGKIGRALKPGEILALSGPLGAGKTTLVQGIAKGLGIVDYVTSPTFALIHEYQGEAFKLYHIDLYRLEAAPEIEDLAIEEYFHKDGICIIEWAEKMKELLPPSHLEIKIEPLSENGRKIWLPLELQARLR